MSCGHRTGEAEEHICFFGGPCFRKCSLKYVWKILLFAEPLSEAVPWVPGRAPVIRSTDMVLPL